MGAADLARIALRNVLRQKQRSLLTAMMMAGGFVLCSISLGTSYGTYSHIIDTFTRNFTGHIQIHGRGYLEGPSLYNTISDGEALGARLAGLPEVQAWTTRVYSPVLVFLGQKTAAARLVGVHPLREGRTSRLKEKVKRGRFVAQEPTREVVIGEGLAAVLQAEIGDEIALIAQGADGSFANDLFEVVGLVGDAAGADARTGCYVHIRAAQDFLALDRRLHEMAVVLEDHARAEEAAQRLAAVLDDQTLEVAPWQVVERGFHQAMQADVKGMWVSFLIIMIIVAVGVLNTVLMAILERTRELGVLRALGTRPRQIFQLVVLETAFLAGMSIAAGAVISLACNYLISIYGIPMPTAVDYGGMQFSRIRSSIAPGTLWIPAAVTLGTAVGVSVFPGLRAARIAPVEALRRP